MSTAIVSKLRSALGNDELATRLLPIVIQPTGISSSGFPYLERSAWEQFRDQIPHILGMGQRTLEANAAIRKALGSDTNGDSENILRACKVVDQIVSTAAVTAPPSLWLLQILRAARPPARRQSHLSR